MKNGVLLDTIVRGLEARLGVKVIDVKRGTRGVVLIADTGVAFPKYIAYKTTVETITGKGIEGFIREARRMFKASGHPLILTPYYITHVIERPLICMRYMKMSLRDYLHERKKLDLTESLALIVQLLKGYYTLKREAYRHIRI